MSNIPEKFSIVLLYLLVFNPLFVQQGIVLKYQRTIRMVWHAMWAHDIHLFMFSPYMITGVERNCNVLE
jgi:hypothetical protein